MLYRDSYCITYYQRVYLRIIFLLSFVRFFFFFIITEYARSQLGNTNSVRRERRKNVPEELECVLFILPFEWKQLRAMSRKHF